MLVANPVTLLALCRRALPRIYRSFTGIWPTYGRYSARRRPRRWQPCADAVQKLDVGAMLRRNKRRALTNRRSALIAERENTEGPAAAARYYADIVYGTALVGLLIEASEERGAWSEAAAICNDLSRDFSIDATILKPGESGSPMRVEREDLRKGRRAGRQLISEAFAANRYRKYELTAQSVMQVAPEAGGIYGLYSAIWIYVDEAEDIRRRLLDHVTGRDDADYFIQRYRPFGFAFETISPPEERSRRLQEVIVELEPLCGIGLKERLQAK